MSDHEDDKEEENTFDSEEQFMDSTSNINIKHQNKTEKQIFEIADIPIIIPDAQDPEKTKKGRFQIPYPLSEQEWNLAISIIQAYKPSLLKKNQEKNG